MPCHRPSSLSRPITFSPSDNEFWRLLLWSVLILARKDKCGADSFNEEADDENKEGVKGFVNKEVEDANNEVHKDANNEEADDTNTEEADQVEESDKDVLSDAS
ncbi:hypothetical protein ACOSP7_023088 [Xanthoceras sorbifolium]